MSANAPDSKQLLRRATAGDAEAIGQLLLRYQPLLRQITREQIPDAVRPRVGDSDVVQASCLSAIRRIDTFVGDQPRQFVAWLKAIHLANLQDLRREHLQTAKRAVVREADLGSSPMADPKQRSAASWSILREERQSLLDALERLPPDQRRAIELRHLEGVKLKDIAATLDRSPQSVAGLLKRGLQSLRQHFDPIRNPPP